MFFILTCLVPYISVATSRRTDPRSKKTISAAVLESTHVDLNDLAARCDLSQRAAIDALMNYGRDKVLRLHEKVQKEPRP